MKIAKRVEAATSKRKAARDITRKKRAKDKGKAVLGLPVLHANTAGIDIGATEIYVAVPADRDDEPVRCFGGFTEDLRKIADWLGRCGVQRVGMEATGVYWIPLWQILADEGFEVCLVNARHFKNVPGKKTDVEDCQWLQFLHSVGLLRSSFRPDQATCGVRTLLRFRTELIQFAAQHIQHMQKALEQMNIKLSHVISDLTGVTGLAIVDAILGGERDLRKLAALGSRRVRASEETLMKSLEGDYRPEHLITLQCSLDLYRHYQTKIAELDKRMDSFMSELPDGVDISQYPLPAWRKQSRQHKQHNAPAFDLRSHCYRILGVDLTAIDGIDEVTAHMVVTEVGADLSAFKSAGNFCSWLRVCPNNRVSSHKILSLGDPEREAPAGCIAAQRGAGAAWEPECAGGSLPAYEVPIRTGACDHRPCAQAGQNDLFHDHEPHGIRSGGFCKAGSETTTKEGKQDPQTSRGTRLSTGSAADSTSLIPTEREKSLFVQRPVNE